MGYGRFARKFARGFISGSAPETELGDLMTKEA
jgi:hypothetical protein